MTEAHPHRRHGNLFVTSGKATMYCLTGCVIGEVAGLMIAITLGLGVWPTIILATSLAYLSGFTLGLLPVVRDRNKTFIEALKLIWFGEVISIGVMEIVMNAVGYSVGGKQADSIFTTIFWIGIATAAPAGFLASWPVNWWLLKRDMKAGH